MLSIWKGKEHIPAEEILPERPSCQQTSEKLKEATGSKCFQQRGGKIPAPIAAKDCETTTSPISSQQESCPGCLWCLETTSC